MFSLLHQFLINYSSLSLPGIGTLQFVDVSAQAFADGRILPPKRGIKLVSNEMAEATPQLLSFLGKLLDMTEMQAQTLFQHFLQSIKTTLAEKQNVQWVNLGEFKKDEVGNISFVETTELDIYHQPIDTKRIIHHTIDKYDLLVGDNETNNVAIQEELNAAANKKSHWWWIWAIIIAVIALVVIAVKYAKVM